MARFSVRQTIRLLFSALACLAVLSSCATAPVKSREAFRLVWTATRTSDHTPLISISMRLASDGSSTVRTDSVHPVEDHPAFPSFTARLTQTTVPGVLQLVTRARLREAARNKKGKLKTSRRDIGALVSIRPGETQLVSLPADPIHLEVRLERD